VGLDFHAWSLVSFTVCWQSCGVQSKNSVDMFWYWSCFMLSIIKQTGSEFTPVGHLHERSWSDESSDGSGCQLTGCQLTVYPESNTDKFTDFLFCHTLSVTRFHVWVFSQKFTSTIGQLGLLYIQNCSRVYRLNAHRAWTLQVCTQIK
jgi:hypothetical protein